MERWKRQRAKRGSLLNCFPLTILYMRRHVWVCGWWWLGLIFLHNTVPFSCVSHGCFLLELFVIRNVSNLFFCKNLVCPIFKEKGTKKEFLCLIMEVYLWKKNPKWTHAFDDNHSERERETFPPHILNNFFRRRRGCHRCCGKRIRGFSMLAKWKENCLVDPQINESYNLILALLTRQVRSIWQQFYLTHLPPTNKLSPTRNISRKWSIVESFPWNLRTSSAPVTKKKRYLDSMCSLSTLKDAQIKNNCIN